MTRAETDTWADRQTDRQRQTMINILDGFTDSIKLYVTDMCPRV